MGLSTEQFIATVQTEAIYRSLRQVMVELDRARRQSRLPDFGSVVSPGRVVSRAIRMLDDIPQQSLSDANKLVQEIIQHQYGGGGKPAFDRVDEKRPG